MSTPTTVQSNLVPIAFSVDDITYKAWLCKKAWNFKGTTPTNVEETDCGPLVGLGSNNFSFDAQIVLNTTPDGATQWLFKDVLGHWNNQTYGYVKVLFPAVTGATFYIQGAGYITNLEVVNQVGNLMTANITFAGNGTVDITP